MARRRKRKQSSPAPSSSPLNLSGLREFIGLPGILSTLLFAVWILFLQPRWSQLETLVGLAPKVTVGLLVTLGLLGILLRQGRTLLLAAVSSLLVVDLPDSQILEAALPLALALIVWLAPRHPFRRRNILSLTVLAAGTWILLSPTAAPWRLRVEPFTQWLPSPQLPILGFLLSGLFLLLLLIRRPSPLARGVFWGLPYLYWTLHGEAASPWSSWTTPSLFALWIVAALGEAHASSFRDALTRLPGRRAFDRELAELGRRYAIAIADIDHFKRVNDRHGHDIGDQVLAKVASQLGRVRGGRAFRYGGEEFVIVFQGRSLEEARDRIENLRQRIGAAPFGVRGSKKSLKVTVSIGVAARNSKRTSGEEVLAAADKALYRAKRAGRNRVQISK